MRSVCNNALPVPARLAFALLLCASLAGCAALTNPIADGIPVHRLPPELLAAHPKDPAVTIPLDLLGQAPPDVYRLAPGDVLGVYIEGVLGDKAVAPPVNLAAPPLLSQNQRRLPPAFGYPIPVREDGTVHLPLVGHVPVQGLSISQAEDSISALYLKKQLLPPGRERVLLSLLFPRQVSVVVLRQETGSISVGPQGALGGGRRGSGITIDLPAYENDLLHALAQTGGLPGLDAYNAIFIFRGVANRSLLLDKLRGLPPGHGPEAADGLAKNIIEIPLRLPPGTKLPVRPEDVVLQAGDVVFTEARDRDVFYAAGLLPTGEYVLPRDYDLDVIQAIALVKGPLVNGGFGSSNLSGTLIASGLGAPSPSLLTVLRKTPGGGQVAIRVDLNQALRDRRERLLVCRGDTLVLQEKPSEGLTRYFTQAFFNFNLAWEVIHSPFATGVVNVAAPDRINGVTAPLPTVSVSP